MALPIYSGAAFGVALVAAGTLLQIISNPAYLELKLNLWFWAVLFAMAIVSVSEMKYRAKERRDRTADPK